MPELESNLLKASAQQTKPWRAGTPGRAPRYRRAVVDYRRPLCLFILSVVFSALGSPSFAQQSPARKVAFQVRAGVMAFSPLVEDELGSSAVDDAIPGQSERVTLRQQLAPALILAALWPMQERTGLEISLGFATSSLEGEDDLGTWDLGAVSLANAQVGVSYALQPTLIAHGGIGLTRLFGDPTLLDDGNGIRPLLEAGLSFVTPTHPALQLDARVQAHRFTTTALQNEGASDGTVLRLVGTASYTLGGARR
jgi:hypothetical protein